MHKMQISRHCLHESARFVFGLRQGGNSNSAKEGGEMTNRIRPSQDLVRQIVSEEAVHAGIDPAWIFAKDRRATVTWARARVCKRLVGMDRYSFPGIAKALCLRDHTSVMYAARREIPNDPPKLSDRGTRRPSPPARSAKPERKPHHRWVTQQDKERFIHFYRSGMTIQAIHDRTGRGHEIIRRTLAEAGITERRGI
jgi:hypothetical protein